MIATIEYLTKKHQVDLSKPINISIPLQDGKNNVNAWYIESPKISPVRIGDWVGSTKEGGDVNFNQINFNPHSHCTHTETVGHISNGEHSIHRQLNQFFFLAELITISPQSIHGDMVITKKQLQNVLSNKKRDAIVIRTIPNLSNKKSMNYSNTNPIYMLEEAAIYLKEKKVKHLLIDLPSVDKEKDQGALLAHNAFWNTSGEIRTDATITELIYVPDLVVDGTYFLNIMVAPFENDATPSKPVLYKILNS